MSDEKDTKAIHFTFPHFEHKKPKAKNLKREKSITVYVCNRCGHKWLGNKEHEPKVCPKCKSVYWNAPRKLYYDWHAKHSKKVVKV